MKYNFTPRSTNVPNSGIGHMMRYSAKYNDVISLGQGTPQFPTPQFIYDHLVKRAQTDRRVGMYAGKNIENELLELVQSEMDEIYGFIPDIKNLEVTAGGIAALFSAMMSLFEKDDEVIYFDPSYPLHLAQLHIVGAKPKFLPLKEEESWSLNIDLLEKSINSNVKGIILTNPNNPTGTVLSKEEVQRLAKIVKEKDLILILDEAYEFLVYDKEFYSPLREKTIRDNIVLCKSFSKEFAMTGWRIGYVYAHEDIIKRIFQIQLHFLISPPTPSIVAAIAALSDPKGKEFMHEMKETLRESREIIAQRLDNLSNLFEYTKPEGAFYYFPKYKNFDIPAIEFAKMLVDEVQVITIPGSSMGPTGKGHLRMAFATDQDTINKAFDRIDKFAKKHNLI